MTVFNSVGAVTRHHLYLSLSAYGKPQIDVPEKVKVDALLALNNEVMVWMVPAVNASTCEHDCGRLVPGIWWCQKCGTVAKELVIERKQEA